MIGSIDRRILLDEVFKEIPFLCEVYTTDFSFEKEFATFVFLTRYKINPTKTINQLNVIYPGYQVNAYFTTDYKSILLENTHILWREGKFYVR